MSPFRISTLFVHLICLICLIALSNTKSIERVDKMNGFPSMLRRSTNDAVQDSNQKDSLVSSDASSDQIINIIRGSLAKLPGESMGKLIEKRSTFSNRSKIEQLLESEINAVDLVGIEEAGCYIEIKIIKRIPGRCALRNGEPVCKGDNYDYYEPNKECSFNI